MKTRLVRIGNSRGLRLAKPLIDQLGFEDEVDAQSGAERRTHHPAISRDTGRLGRGGGSPRGDRRGAARRRRRHAL